jgi:NAD(P)H-hydrate epimerase
MASSSFLHPVLSCAAAKALEAEQLKDEAAEWAAMRRAGDRLAQAVIEDYKELRELPGHLRVLALVGKGNNGGDAMITCARLLADFPRARVDVILAVPPGDLGPLASRAWREIEGRVHGHVLGADEDAAALHAYFDEVSGGRGFHVAVDGLLGMSFQPPVRPPIARLLEAVNAYERIDLRAAVDLPSGWGEDVEPSESAVFRADFSYATGTMKKPLVKGAAVCGRIRYLDLGFFDEVAAEWEGAKDFYLLASVLDPLRCLRPVDAEKRRFGHLMIVGGSAYMPGALLMAVHAAVRSGTGLVTAFAPASVASSLAAQLPEAMWVPWPETSNGTLSPRAMPLLRERLERADAVLVGPGMGHDRQTDLLIQEIVQTVDLPLILDADALRLRVIEMVARRRAHWGRVVLTPHLGEFKRMNKSSRAHGGAESLREFCANHGVTTLLKGPITRVCDGASQIYSSRGGPVLARGGSGDLLAGLIGSQIAQDNRSVTAAVARGLMLHGLAAERLARARGQAAVSTTQILDFLPEVLRS